MIESPSAPHRLDSAAHQRFEAILDAFEEAWKSGTTPPAIEDFLPDTDPDRLLLLEELVLTDLEFRLKAGQEVRLEEYLGRFPELADNEAAVLRGLAHEFHLRRRRPPFPTLGEYLERFPHYRDQLARCLTERATPFPLTTPALSPTSNGAPATLPAVPGYEVLEELGRGGMGVVYKARQVALGRLVALKLIRDSALADTEQAARFRVEAEALARLQHPNVVQIHEVGEHNGLPFLALEWVQGGSLRQRLAQGPLSPQEGAALVETLARAAGAAHACGVVHRDLKPDNVLLTVDGVPKITDFGLAKKLDATVHTHTGAVLGTPSYMAPEQAAGASKEVGPAADVYALGAILYELLTGRPPFLGATTLETLQQVLADEPVPPRRLRPNLPRDLEVICLKCLEKVPRSRYATAADLAEDLRRFRAGEPVTARPAGMLRRAAKWARRRPVAAALVAVSVAAALGLAGLSLWLWSALEDRQAALGVATTETARARSSEARMRRSLYGADLRRVFDAYHEGDMRTMRALLDGQGPAAGEEIDEAGFEWGYWMRLIREVDRGAFAAHQGEVLAVAFSPDGRTLATAGRDGRVCLWDPATRQPRTTLAEGADPVVRLTFCDGGRTLAGVHPSGAGRFWDLESRQERSTPFPGPARSVRPALSPDGELLAVVGNDPREVQLWVRATGKMRWSRQIEERVTALAFTPDGEKLAIAFHGGVFLWTTDTATRTYFCPMLPDSLDLAFSPNGWRLAAAQDSGDVLELDVRKLNLRVLFPDNENQVYHCSSSALRCVAFAPDSEQVAGAGNDGIVRLWRFPRTDPVKEFRGATDYVTALAFAPDGRTLACGGRDGAVRLWNTAQRQDFQPLPVQPRPTGRVALAAGGGLLAVACEDHSVSLVDFASGAVRRTCAGHKGTIQALAFAPRDRILATVARDLTLRLWDTASGQPRAGLDLPDIPFAVAFSPDSRLVAVALNNGQVRWWEGHDGFSSLDARLPLAAPPAAVRALVFSPDSRTLIAGGEDGIARCWDTATGKKQESEMKMAGPIRRLALSHDGRVLAAALPERMGIEWWNVPGRTLLRKSENRPINALAFSPDDRNLAIGQHDFLFLLDTSSGAERLCVPDPHSGPVPGLAFHPDGKTLISAGAEGLVKIWDFDTWTMRKPGGSFLGAVRALAFDPSGRRLFVGSDEPLRKGKTLSPPGNREQWIGRVDDVRVWDLAAGTEEPLLPDQPPLGAPCLALTPDGRSLLAGSKGGTLWRWDLDSRKALPLRFVNAPAEQSWRGVDEAKKGPPSGPHDVHALAVSPREERFATLTAEGEVQVHDAATGDVRRILPRKHADPACLAFDPATGTLAVNDGGEVRLWDPISGEERGVLSPGHSESIVSMAYSPNGRFLASGGRDRRIRLWDLEARDQGPRVLFNHLGPVSSLAFSPDSRTLASGALDTTIALWHVATAHLLAVLPGSGEVHALAFSPDGTILASGDGRDHGGEVRLWRTDAAWPPGSRR